MKIYTKTGDLGQTSLFDGERVKKSNLRLQVYGELDGLNVVIGKCRFKNDIIELNDILERITNEIFIMCSVLATKDLNFLPDNCKNIDFSKVDHLESVMDDLTEKMPKLTNFIFPGGSELSLLFHEARVVIRKAERIAVELTDFEKIDAGVLIYLNRLSDLFFTFARYANFKLSIEEEVWKVA